MDRADVAGLGVALAAHGALLAALAIGLAGAQLPPIRHQPIEVSFVDEVGLVSQAPVPAAEGPAPRLAQVEAPVEPAPPLPSAEPVPQPRIEPRLQPKAAVTPRPRRDEPAPTRTKAGGRLNGLLTGLGETDSASRSNDPPAQKAGPAVEASLASAVRRQVKPQWQRAVPTGADAESLRTKVKLSLSRDGRLVRVDVLGTEGITASNRPQVALHQERARRAVTLAAPYELPPQFYDAWKEIEVTLDLRLSQ
jgi:outer membrane biosynthesis protein TonB